MRSMQWHSYLRFCIGVPHLDMATCINQEPVMWKLRVERLGTIPSSKQCLPLRLWNAFWCKDCAFARDMDFSACTNRSCDSSAVLLRPLLTLLHQQCSSNTSKLVSCKLAHSTCAAVHTCLDIQMADSYNPLDYGS